MLGRMPNNAHPFMYVTDGKVELDLFQSAVSTKDEMQREIERYRPIFGRYFIVADTDRKYTLVGISSAVCE